MMTLFTYLSKKNKFGFNAFTLAEVLITLGIIGIIAELTIPVIMQDVQDAQITVGVKSAYRILTEATNTLTYNVSNNTLDLSSVTKMADSYATVLKVTQRDSVMTNVFSSPYRYYKNYASAYVFPATWDGAIIILANGMFVRFSADASCSTDSGGTLGAVTCGTFNVDINGNKKPNMFGKDFVAFLLVRINGVYKVLPYSNTTTAYTCTATNAGTPWLSNGFGCTEYYILNNTLP